MRDARLHSIELASLFLRTKIPYFTLLSLFVISVGVPVSLNIVIFPSSLISTRVC